MTAIDDTGTEALVRGVTARLAPELEGVFAAQTIEAWVRDTSGRWPNPRITDFLPVMVERFARERLRALGRIEGKLVTEISWQSGQGTSRRRASLRATPNGSPIRTRTCGPQHSGDALADEVCAAGTTPGS